MPFSSHPFDVKRVERKSQSCPKCGEVKNVIGRALQWELRWHCNACGNEWSGGMGVSIPEPGTLDALEGVPEPPDLDLPSIQYTGQDFRDPSKNHPSDD